ncbi:MAG: hypothetical protein P8Y67_07595, partial [Alphaproteobacteria bacterium]
QDAREQEIVKLRAEKRQLVQEIAKLRAEIRQLKCVNRSEALVSVLNNGIRWGGLSWLAYCGYLSITALAGKFTSAEFLVNILAKENISVTLAWSIGAIGLIYGYIQRTLRKNTVERLQSRIVKLERHIDDRRSSSKLTPRGDTRREDKYE